jgi:hypothetical protein
MKLFNKNRHKLRRIVSLAISLLLSVSLTNASEILKHLPGDEITQEEAQIFSLFENFDGFLKAEVDHKGYKQIGIKVYSEVDGEEIEEEILFSSTILWELNKIIDQNFKTSFQNKPPLKYSDRIVLDDKTVTGEIIRWSGDGIDINVDGEIYTVILKYINAIIFDNLRNYEDEFNSPEDPNNVRLFLGPTGRSLKAGKGYFSDTWVFLPSINYAFTDRIAIGGGATVIDILAGKTWWFTPKVGLIQSKNLAVSTGVIHFQVYRENESEDEFFDKLQNFGIAYGVGTYGNNNYSITLGIGHGYETLSSNKTVVMAGGECRITKGIKIISENWYYSDFETRFSLIGIRAYINKGALDIAMLNFGEGEYFRIPWLTFTVNF